MSLKTFTELDDLRKDMLLMGSMVETAVESASSALIDRRTDLVSQVIEGDKEIDIKETSIDEECHRLLALSQPVANYLRVVVTAIKVANELERMGDHAKSLAYAADKLASAPALPVYDQLRSMARKTVDMVRGSLDSLVSEDIETARKVHAADDEVDQLYHQIREAIAQMMDDRSASIQVGLECIGAAQNLERIADLSTNIAKDVIYLVEGQLVPHRHQRETEHI